MFGEAQLVVCHGGSGTVFGALAAGVPMVVVPVFADQFENGRRVSERGAGLSVEAPPDGDGGRQVVTDGDAPRIAEAIAALMQESRYRTGARAVAAEMAAALTVDEVLESLR